MIMSLYFQRMNFSGDFLYDCVEMNEGCVDEINDRIDNQPNYQVFRDIPENSTSRSTSKVSVYCM